ncbi:unnamed protein product [Xylocopa violacea]|uniref:Mitochondrial transcription rescue factor 1 C-terminal domain-containing protein n=1 Tax=Xylocopa violacea TaxID=135666 RepID=A0ABP1MZ89_XYLVO
MLHRTLFNIAQRKICTNVRILRTLENTPKFNSKQCSLFVNHSYPQQSFTSIILKRFKSKGNIAKDAKHEKEEEEEEEEEDLPDVDDYLKTEKSKLIQTFVKTLRLDVIAKMGFEMSRAQFEKEFYSGSVRLNGQKCIKKHVPIFINDEIDIILSRSTTNPKNIIVNRCKLLVAKLRQDNPNDIKIALLQNKNLLIEDYDKCDSDD